MKLFSTFILIHFNLAIALAQSDYGASYSDFMLDLPPELQRYAKPNPIESPFEFSCQQPEDVKNAIEIWDMVAGPPIKDKEGVLAKDFLLGVLNKMIEYNSQNIQFAHNLNRCQSRNGPNFRNPNCEEVGSWVRNDLLKLNQFARMNLALANSPRVTSPDINRNLRVPINDTKEIPWQPLSADEVIKAEEYLQEITEEQKKEVEVEMNRPIDYDPKYMHYETYSGQGVPDSASAIVQREIQKERDNVYLVDYIRTVTLTPILQYMSSANPTGAEIADAAQRLKQNGEASQRRLQDIRDNIAGLKQNDRIPYESLTVFSAPFFVENFLEENPKYCSIAASLKHVQSTVGGVATTALLGGSVALGFFAPMSLAIAAGTGLGVGFIYYGSIHMAREKQWAFSQRHQFGEVDINKFIKEATPQQKIELANRFEIDLFKPEELSPERPHSRIFDFLGVQGRNSMGLTNKLYDDLALVPEIDIRLKNGYNSYFLTKGTYGQLHEQRRSVLTDALLAPLGAGSSSFGLKGIKSMYSLMKNLK